MRTIIIAAIALAFVGAAHATPQSAQRSCAFNMRLSQARCARLYSTPVHGRAGGWTRDTASSSTLLYASDPFNDAVDIETVTSKGFTHSGSLTIAGALPLGLTVDHDQNLYVAGAVLTSGTPSVQVFPRGSTKPSKTYTSGLTGPIDVAVDQHGTVYVSNLLDPKGGGCGEGSGPGGSVVEYAKGSMKPTHTISGFPGCPNGVAVDSKSNLYLTYIYYPTSGFVESDVIEYPYGSTKGKALGLEVPGGPELGGLAFDAKGDLLVENVQDDATLNQLLTFPQGSKTPTNTIQYGGTGWASFKYFALDGNRYFAPAYIAENLSYVPSPAAAFEYPSGRQLFAQTTPLAFAYGIALSPGK
jgi:hypothetical protein